MPVKAKKSEIVPLFILIVSGVEPLAGAFLPLFPAFVPLLYRIGPLEKRSGRAWRRLLTRKNMTGHWSPPHLNPLPPRERKSNEKPLEFSSTRGVSLRQLLPRWGNRGKNYLWRYWTRSHFCRYGRDFQKRKDD